MSTLTKKSFYIIANVDGECFFSEGDFTEQEINRQINDFDIDEFLKEAEEESGGVPEGHYAIYRQSMMTTEEALAIGYATQKGNTITMNYHAMTDAQKQHYDNRCAELAAEIEAEFGIDKEPLVCLKPFAKVVA
jgi:hypothetical protein